MEFFKQKTSEVPFWVLLLAAAGVFLLVHIVYDMITTDNLITTTANGSFQKKSWFGPLSAEEKFKIAQSFDKKVADAASKKEEAAKK